MKLSRLYCNLPELFGPVAFNAVRDKPALLSVVFGRITKPRDPNRDSHNLGKTTLIYLIDFMLLQDISDQNHFLAKHYDRFRSFVFFLEIETHSGSLVTVRRSVEQPTRIALKKEGAEDATEMTDLVSADDAVWDHVNIPLVTAREILDAYIDLRICKPWDYRKGVSYFLRAQADYQDVFQISKFLKGQDLQWKPYVAHILGLKADLIDRKYQLDTSIADAERRRIEKQAEVQVDQREYNKLANQIDIQRRDLRDSAERLSAFDFREEERRVNKEVVQDVEQQISYVNDAIYNLDYELSQIRKALRSGFSFKLEEIRQIFDETSTYFPEALQHDYEQLLTFNKKVTHERNVLLRRQLRDLEGNRTQLESTAEELNNERKALLQILRNADTFDKFKALQNEHSDQRGHLTYLENQLERLERVREISHELREFTIQRDQVVAEVAADVERNGPVLKRLAMEFHALVRRVLGLRGQFYVTMNRSGNVEFHVGIELDAPVPQVSSQSEGISYKKLLCALYDIALLKTYSNAPFYHFVYHDGIFEGLDN